MKKRLFIPLLSLCTTLALLTVFISAEETPPTSGDCGPSATWSYDQESKTLTISGSGDVITEDWYSNTYYVPWRDEVEVVEFEGADFSSLKNRAFYNWSNLSSITLPEGMTEIGNAAFEGCSALTSITIPDGVTSIEGRAFCECSSLTSVILPDSVTSIEGNSFYKCSKLAGITIPEGMSSIANSTFWGCSNLTDVILPSTVTSIGESAFCGCSSLTSIDIPDGVTNIGMFAFVNCSSLTSIIIPDGVTHIGQDTFTNCASLTNITIPQNVSRIDLDAFSGCTGLTEIKVDPDSANYSSVDGVLFNRAKDTLVIFPAGKQEASYSIPNGVTSIAVSAFSDCTGLTSVSIPEGVTSIGNSAFWECTNLTEITIPEGVESIGSNAFRDCSKLASVTIPESVTSIDYYAFKGCSKLTSVTIPKNVRNLWRGVFSDCASLTEIRTDPDNTDYVSVDGVLFGRKKNTLVAFPAGRQGAYAIPDYVYSIYDDAFAECAGLTSVSIPNSVTSIGFRSFAGCTGLTSVTIPKSVSIIDYSPFDDCIGLTDVYYGGSNKQWRSAGGPVQINNGTTIIHFAFTEVYTVTYDANGGTGEMSDVQMQDVGRLTLPACGFTAPKNQKFKWWRIGDVSYTPGSTYFVTCDTTVKAIWEKDEEPVPPDDETYAITVSETITNGKVETNVKEAAAGTTVTVTAMPNPGYKVGEITVTKSDGSKVPVTNGAFQMPAGNVTVSASFTASTTSKLSAVWRANEENILKGELVIQGTSAEKWYLIEMKKGDTESSLTNSVFFILRGDESGTLIVQCENGVTLNMYEMDGNKISDFANSHQFVQDQTADGPLEIL